MILKNLKKIVIKYLSYPSIFLIAIIRALKIRQEKIVESEINLGKNWNLLFKISGLKRGSLISSESNKLSFYSISNQGIESFQIKSIESQVKVNPDESIVFVVLKDSQLKRYLLMDLYTKRILNLITTKKNQKEYLKDCINNLKLKLKETNNKKIQNQYSFNYRYEGYIQYFKNIKRQSKRISFKNSKIIFSKTKNKSKNFNKNKKRIPKRIIVFYLDNFSINTMKKVKDNEQMFPNLSSLFQSKKNVLFNNSMSISNWTYPAAISFLTGLRFEHHKKYYPWERNYLDLISKIYKSRNLNNLENIYENFEFRFRAGSNWRMHHHHGLNSFFTNIMSNPKMADIYSVMGQSLKQLDISGNEPSFHWIDIMDTHHPVKNSILPVASSFLNLKTLKEGLHFENGSKYKNGEHLDSTKNIYLAQIKSVDYFIGIFLNHSYKKIAKEDHLICFISDHGTHIMNNGSDFSIKNELFNPLISVISNENNFKYFSEASKLAFSPVNFLKLLNYSFDANKVISKYEEHCYEFPYSQIIYPNQPYRLLIKYSLDKIYEYTSDLLMPKSIVNSDNNLSEFLKKSIKKGTWKIIRKNQVIQISEIELPINIKNLVNLIIN